MDIRLTDARIAFAHALWTPGSAMEGGIPKYNCDYIVEPDTKIERRDVTGRWVPTTLDDAQLMVAAEAFKGDTKRAKAWFDTLDNRQKSVRDGNKNLDKSGDVRMGFADRWYVHATSVKHMPVRNAQGAIVTDERESPVYSGCYVQAVVSLYANTQPAKKGVFASLCGTMFRKDGDAFGGGRAATDDDFDAVAEGADAGDFS